MSRLQCVAAVALLVFLGTGLFSCGESSQAPTTTVPIEVLFSPPEKSIPTLSPDGLSLAYRMVDDWGSALCVLPHDADEPRVLVRDSLFGIDRYLWSADGTRIFYMQDLNGNGNLRLYDVVVETGAIRDLTPFENVQAQILDVNRRHPEAILFALNRDNPRAHSVYRLEVASGNFNLVAENPGNIFGWLIDADMKVRGCLEADRGGGFNFLVADEAGGKWRTLLSWNSGDILTSSPIGFDRDAEHAYILDSRNANAGRLVRVNLADGSEEVIAEDSVYNVTGAMIHPETREIQAVTFTRARQENDILDESIRDDFAAIAKLHAGDFFLSSRDAADDTWLVGFNNDSGAVPFYRYERATKEGTFLFMHNDLLKDIPLSAMEPIEFTARDGQNLHGYISFPPDQPRTNLPMVVFVHDGPWRRDTWGFNSDVQWLTSRGYICLQVNFRGSTGYGKHFTNLGNKQWGGAMLDDVVDGVRWAVARGYADPGRTAVYGWRYGGYTALMAAIRYPDVFRCAVDVSGYVDLAASIKAIPPYQVSQVQYFFNRVGNPEYEMELLESISPLRLADSVAIPVMIVHGAMNTMVLQADVETIIASLNERGIDNRYILLDDEGHGLQSGVNRIMFYETAETFLEKHLGPTVKTTVASD